MPIIRSRTLFFTTSPRTPSHMVPEISLLVSEFDQEPWNATTQTDYMNHLIRQDFYRGRRVLNDPAFSARDRITRAPKALGFVDLEPVISLTPAGDDLLNGNQPSEALLRQLLKFQLPSPYHRLPESSATDFYVRPYLEMIRLVRRLGWLGFDELMAFGMQLTSISKFEQIVDKIERFRVDREALSGDYAAFVRERIDQELAEVYSFELSHGLTDTRESDDNSISRFVRTKRRNLRDYADACFRYLGATELLTISQEGHSLFIPEDCRDDIDFILETVHREPVWVDDIEKFKSYLFQAGSPGLYSDQPEAIQAKVRRLDPKAETQGLDIGRIKDVISLKQVQYKQDKLGEEVRQIKSLSKYADIETVFDKVLDKEYFDNPLMMEWNTWRAMVMIDGGSIIGNFVSDNDSRPFSTAPGNTSDIVCEYEGFDLLVEVTLQTGARQYDSEGEPVARHVGRHKESTGKPTYCLFIAPKLNPSVIAHFYVLHRLSVSHYGGITQIIPMELSVFREMLAQRCRWVTEPDSTIIEELFSKSVEIASSADDEEDWYRQVTDYAVNLLAQHG